MKILVTGAHFTPAVATIEELKEIEGMEVVYVGRGATQEGDQTPSVESRVLPSLGVRFISLITGRLQREFTLYTIPSLLKIPLGFLQALFIVFKEKPDVILSFGGYIAVPVVVMGWLFSIPIIVHEQTLLTGLANKICAFFADRIAVSFDNGLFKGEKVILTGNPIRHEIIKNSAGANISKASLLLAQKVNPPRGWIAGRVPVVLVMGGNQGSHAINLAVEECLNKLVKIARVYHQTGDSKFRDHERLGNLRNFGKLAERYTIIKWIGEEYREILQEADLVVSRAGINTLIELALLGKPTLLIPIPNKEQKQNAQYFEDLGLVTVLPQSKLSGKALLQNINLMLKKLDNLKEKAKDAKKVIIPDAAKRLALETVILGQKGVN